MLILIEGMDKVGKSTVARHFQAKKAYEYVHMTAPRKGITRSEYLAEMLRTIADTAGKNVVIDRTWYGELVWPYIYNRTPILFNADCQLLTQVAFSLHEGEVQRLYMYDSDREKHQERMREHKEPSYNYDLASHLYATQLSQEGFKFLTYQEAEAIGWTKYL